ncbi:peptidoglycan-binding protein [Streptomyces sp. NPDC058470]|uniref:peptidoglycan-binding protein n=1 Tax=Streptomyces sp. NPDC058470 TaxID=3346515 RepID=UPI00364D5EA1
MIRSPAQAIADSAAPPPSVLTAPVERRVLTDSVILRGTVIAEQTVDVAPTGAVESGTSVVTKLPLAAGSPFKAGRVLLEVSGRPVFALEGELPVYRDLKPGVEGEDVAQLQEALRRLGHGSGNDRQGYFGSGTKSALAAFYTSIGYDPRPAQPDGDALEDEARDAVTAAERAVEDSQESEAEDRAKQEERARQDLDGAREQLAEVEAANGPMLPASEVVFLETFPARVESVASRVGAQVDGRVLTVSAGALVVNGFLQQHQKGLVRSGQKVEVLSEVTGETASAAVSSVAESIAQEQAVGADGQAVQTTGTTGYLMVVRPTEDLDPSLAGQDVRLTVQAASTGSKALVVPVSAVAAGADGKPSVTVLTGEGVRRRVPVATGTTGDGYVEVKPLAGGKLSEGERAITGVQTDVSSEERAG